MTRNLVATQPGECHPWKGSPRRSATPKSMVTALALALAVSLPLHAQDSSTAKAGLSAAQIVERSLQSFYSPGDDMRARVTMKLIDKDGRTRTRVLTMLRRDTDAKGNQRYFMYFHEPADVRQMTFMVWKYPDRDDDRWIFIPAVDLIRRIAADDKRSSFVGSDFTYEDVSGRDVTADRHTLSGEETFNGRPCYVIQSVPVEGADYTKKVSWIDQENFLPLKETYYDAQGELFRQFTADEIRSVPAGQDGGKGSVPTVTRRTMANVKRGHRTEVVFDSIQYDIGLQDADFSERNMRRPPAAWIE